MAIKINIQPTAEDLAGKSHWWGFPDLPEAFEWPCNNDGDLLTFICQISLEDVVDLDTEGRLPHKGMLWFFAELDYFLGDLDAPCGGTGEWEPGTFKVLYSEDNSDLLTHEYYWEDGEPAVLPAEEMTFETASETDFGFRLLGMPAMTEGYENENEGLMSLLQMDEEERWGLRFFDCGTVNFMVPTERADDDFSNVSFCLHSS
ncbi:MAG: DUF1963 domain-containing protein [Bacteroidales bacterium]|nr:DUF1963 domain-containing protein [Bacteroidales bacterium]